MENYLNILSEFVSESSKKMLLKFFLSTLWQYRRRLHDNFWPIIKNTKLSQDFVPLINVQAHRHINTQAHTYTNTCTPKLHFSWSNVLEYSEQFHYIIEVMFASRRHRTVHAYRYWRLPGWTTRNYLKATFNLFKLYICSPMTLS